MWIDQISISCLILAILLVLVIVRFFQWNIPIFQVSCAEDAAASPAEWWPMRWTASTGLYDSGILGNNRGMMKPTTPFPFFAEYMSKTPFVRYGPGQNAVIGSQPQSCDLNCLFINFVSSRIDRHFECPTSDLLLPGNLKVKSILSLFHMWNNFPEHPQPASHCQVELGTLAPSKFLFINVHRMLVILTCSPTTVLFTVSAQIILYPNLLYPRFIVMGLQLPHPSWQVCRLGGQKEQSWQWIKNHSNPYSHAIIFNMGMFLWV